MRYYKDNAGHIAKFMRTSNRYVVMTTYRTLFFTSECDAMRFLVTNNYR